MTERVNDLGQPIGRPLPGWEARPFPPRTPIPGRLCRLEPLDADTHAAPLHAAHAEAADGRYWTYLPYGPFPSAEAYADWVRNAQARDDLVFYAIVDVASALPVGAASYLRIAPDVGSIEVGHLSYSPALQRTAMATEAMYLMMRRAFDELGYRRYEWKCDSLNAPSRAAALRLGFRYEGLFRDAVVYKGRSRDNAWFSIVADEWPALRTAFERWLDPANFEGDGSQRTRLSDCIAGARA
jgi:RimJ/RimL family protein N-acetyltransferase